MKRVNIVLEEWQYQYLKDRAEREGKSISALVRDLVAILTTPPREGLKSDPIFKIVGIAKGRRRYVSRHHDEILYRKDW
ncbi:hypothetical protein HRbin07_00113 [bacterium HR07]|nr:hypothetical protein HRbin07_00113 [bacterium HR07]